MLKRIYLWCSSLKLQQHVFHISSVESDGEYVNTGRDLRWSVVSFALINKEQSHIRSDSVMGQCK